MGFPRWFWPSFAAPATGFLAVFFLFAFYVTLAVTFGGVDPILQTPDPAWSPADWDPGVLSFTISNITHSDGIYHAAFLRTLGYVATATALCLVVGYPFAYFLARHAGRWRGVFLALFLAPFWISYMLRMTAWIGLLEDEGLVNRALDALGLVGEPIGFLDGRASTLIFGLVYGYVPYMILPLFAVLDRIPASSLEAARDLGASPRSTFLRVTLPASRQGIVAGVIVCGLPMFGDYFTQQLLADSNSTRMLGNFVVQSLQVPIFVSRGAALILVAAHRADRLLPGEHHPSLAGAVRVSRLRTVLSNPWGRARFLWAFAVAYVVWTAIPIVTAVVFSFNETRSISIFTGFSLRWWIADPDDSLLRDPAIRQAIAQTLRLASLTTLLAVPFGVAFALGLDRWRGRTAAATNFVMMLSFITPELILAVSLFLLFINTFSAIGLGTGAQLVGLTVLSLAYPVVIVRARLVSLGRDLEEAAMDLGCSPVQSLLRVTLPLLMPAILASAAIVFAIALDDFVTVQQLARDAPTQTVSMYIYGTARGAPTPAANAVGTLMLAASTLLIVLAYVGYRRAERRQGVRMRVELAA